ncbi:transporter substrate-binding domain-containing protein [Pseudoalteromonas sp. MM17-2]|uniref:substrate-binding periplasmic protein n=1 Tax=Pseudoalteromonas sp. MM17-2 TaxID=2917753 RepID=UPI001EF456D9|nr:transporter substrate-binding domain-containing protein [Pseudoalteromonas sp. MM17-2]MCG7545694.1 transporter substrate-binding domain-containing protein [Pseudoalteromonas sp. MM17-2]
MHTLYAVSAIVLLMMQLWSSSSWGTPAPLRICFERWWPYSYVDESMQAKGIEVDLIRYALSHSGTDVIFTELPYKRCVEAVTQGKFDFTLHVDETDGLAMLDQSFVNWELTLAVAIKRQESFYQQAVQRSPIVLIAEEYPYPDEVYSALKALNADIVTRSYYESTDAQAKSFFSTLSDSRVDAIVVDRTWAAKIIHDFDLPVALLHNLHIEPQYIGYHPNNEKKALRLQHLLSSIPESVKKEIERRYQQP